MKDTIEFMREFQRRRRGADIPQPNPSTVGCAIDALILHAERYEKVRFDDMVDAL